MKERRCTNVIIIPCHNRSAYTLRCLQNLKSLDLLAKYEVVIVDDGSTDGTAAQVSENFPEVTVLIGSGDLFWTGAVELGMRHAMKWGAETIVWMNDDASITDGALDRLVQVAEETGGMTSALGFVNMHTIGKNWYFPVLHRSLKGLVADEILPHSGLIAADACRGNLVAINRRVIESIGFPDARHIPHVCGDTDYSLRATRAGLPCTIVTEVLLEELDTIRGDNHSWLLGQATISSLWRGLFSKRSSHYPPMRWVYLTRHWGVIGVFQFPSPYVRLAVISLLRLVIPRNILIRVFGHASHAWKAHAWRREIKNEGASNHANES